MNRNLVLAALLIIPLVIFAQSTMDWSAPLPPAPAWDGKSQALLVDADDPWITPSERTGLTATPNYAETMAWLRKLAAAAPQVQLISIGTSHEQRDIWMVIVSTEQASTPAALKSTGKPTLLAQAGIHSGEIDGKDAGLMFLRDLTVRGTKAKLLKDANFLFIPILSVDGHERSSRYGRINQRGPVESGWRTNARNLNLNRDYTKLDTPEMQAVIRILNQWDPDLYLDLHVTDGIDYQYDITFGYTEMNGYSSDISAWLDQRLTPALNKDLAAKGHIPGPLIFAVDNLDPSKGIESWTAWPRYSTGYGDARHLPSVLVENHSLKPYRQRVLGTYVLLESTLKTLGKYGKSLRKAVTADRARQMDVVPLSWDIPEGSQELVEFLGIRWEIADSPISGEKVIRYTGQPITLRIPNQRHVEPDIVVQRPQAYWIPPAWSDVIERLAMHGIYTETLTKPRNVMVHLHHLSDIELGTEPYEGHLRVSATSTLEPRSVIYPPGSVRVPTDQPLGDLAVVLLEPKSADSFFQWGFFPEVLQRAEYVEEYVMEPLAARMLQQDPSLRDAFAARLEEDPDFAADPQQRLQWFYERTPYFDQQWRYYPVGIEQ
jgi:hypothetical protein